MRIVLVVVAVLVVAAGLELVLDGPPFRGRRDGDGNRLHEAEGDGNTHVDR